jgi:hypothetical protein
MFLEGEWRKAGHIFDGDADSDEVKQQLDQGTVVVYDKDKHGDIVDENKKEGDADPGKKVEDPTPVPTTPAAQNADNKVKANPPEPTGGKQ